MSSKKIYYFSGINFLSAFLLFQIELIISKFFLPKFGGSYLVWGACMVFFQCALLLGYFYSHVVIQRFTISRYLLFQVILLAVPLISFPGRALPVIYSHEGIPLVIDVFAQLVVCIGIVFFVLSTISIVTQSWLSVSSLAEHSNPYMLYAVSNFGSFAALLSYPFLFERYLDLKTQLALWRNGYFLLVALFCITYLLVKPSNSRSTPEQAPVAVPRQQMFRWFLFSAASVIVFLAVTNIVTYEIAPLPLFWVIPLALYLISFVLNFKKKPFCPPWVKEKFHFTLAFCVFLFFLTQQRNFPIAIEITAYYALLFVICMFCQNELAQDKPKEPRALTTFYLILAGGGFVGGIFVSWIMPLVSTVMIELLVGLFVISAALIIGEKKRYSTFYSMRLIVYSIFIITLWPLVFKDYNVFGLALLFFLFWALFSELKKNPKAVFFCLFTFMCTAPLVEPLWSEQDYLYFHRNYYGIYSIYERYGIRFLKNGTTLHGAQYISPQKETEPLTYYHAQTPVGNVLNSNKFNFQHIGIVGLGAGTLAVYGKADQTIDFYELDRDIFHIATAYFSFLKRSPAKLNYVFGDARLSLKKSPADYYDLLIVDAFSGDSVPIHLLTTEAISEYKKHLRPKGIILFHVSNRYLNLVPVLFNNAHAVNAYAASSSNKRVRRAVLSSVWVALTWEERRLDDLLTLSLKWNIPSGKRDTRQRPWTDSYSNTLSALKLEELLDSIRTFQPFYW